MKTLPIGLFTALALTATLPAQTSTVIYPHDHATIEGISKNATFHLTAGICRFQFSYEDWNLDLPKGAKVTSFGYRQDGSYALTTLRIELEAFMGHNTQPSQKLSSLYASNYDVAPTKVITKKFIDLPAFPRSTAPSKNFVMLKLDAPFAYQHPKNLVTEVKVYGNSNSNKSFNYYLDAAYVYSPWTSLGYGCRTSGRTIPWVSSQPAVLGGAWHLDLQKFPPSAATLLILGASKTKLFGVIDLPFKLDILGMKDCYQHVDMNFILMGPTTNSSGSAKATLNLPLDFKLAGQKIYVQFWAVDVPVNPAGLVTSNGVEVQFGAYPRVHLLYTLGNTTNISGIRIQNHGQVTRFDHQ